MTLFDHNSQAMLNTAKAYVQAGMSVIPIHRGTKEPDYVALGLVKNHTVTDLHGWKVYCERMPTTEELERWFGPDTVTQVAIVGGTVSGGLVRIDLESPACLDVWRSLSGFADQRLHLPIVKTHKGHHIYFRMDDPVGYVRLSESKGEHPIVMAETQGEGCYCLAPPSSTPAGWFSSNERYEWLQGDFLNVPKVDQPTAAALLQAARFPGLWAQTLPAPAVYVSAMQLNLSRDGLRLTRDTATFDLAWSEIGALHRYFMAYAPLLQAVEKEPPPPPSFDEGDDDSDYEE